jgi:hypothetical protein
LSTKAILKKPPVSNCFHIFAVFTTGYEEKLPEILALLKALFEKQTGLQYSEIIIRYIFSTVENMTVLDLKNMVENNLSAMQGEMIMTQPV